MILIYIVLIWMLTQMNAPTWTYVLVVIGAILRVAYNVMEREKT